MRMLSVCLILLATACTPHPLSEISPADVEFRDQALSLINHQRQQGCTCGSEYMPPVPNLIWDSRLAAAAQRHAMDMENNDFFDHIGSDGSRVGNRVSAEGYPWRTVGENIAFGYTSMEEAIQAWIASPTHCKLLMSENFTETGLARSGIHWVQTLGDIAD